MKFRKFQLFKNLWLCLCFTTNLLALPIPSDWFEERKLSSESNIYRQLKLFRKNDTVKFLFYELNFNRTRKWEELRIQGLVLENENTFKVEKCALYGKKDMQKRWALLRAFDCEHLEWKFELQNSSLALKEKNGGFEDFQLELVYKGEHGIFKVMEINENYCLAWGIGAVRFSKAKQGRILNSLEPISILSVRESTIYFQTPKQTSGYVEVLPPKLPSFYEDPM